MMIKKLSASFGKLNGDTLELKDGLNVICAPNESGKSTWCAFIRAMLYGVDSSERAKGMYLPDKLRYLPWSGAPMQGSMELVSDDREISISRGTRLKNAPMREFNAVYTGTSVPVEGMNGQNVGELLTGASRDVFRRSAFIEQGALAVTGSPELEKRIAAIVSTGDEECSFTEADEQLRAWQRKRRFNKRGRLPELENEMAESRQKLRSLEAAALEQQQLSENLEERKKRCEILQSEMVESRKNARKEALANLHNLRGEKAHAEKEYEAAKEKLSDKENALKNSLLGLRDIDEAEREIKADLQKLSELKDASEAKVSFVPAIAFFALTLLCAVLGVLVNPLIFCGCVLAIPGFLLLSKSSKAKKNVHESIKQRRALLGKYEARDEQDIESLLDDYSLMYGEYIEAGADEQKCAAAFSEARKRMEKVEAETLNELDFSDGSGEAAQLSREYSSALARCEADSARIAELKGRIEALGDPMVIASELKCMENEYAELGREYEAIALAVDTLRAADADIQSRFSPELGKLAAHYMSMVTGGRYESVLINRDFSALTRTAGDTVPRETAYLSAGTLDLMYLAVRLAVCKLALPEGESCPLILDDTLVNLDETRTAQAMRLLREIAKERQVVLFTCKKV